MIFNMFTAETMRYNANIYLNKMTEVNNSPIQRIIDLFYDLCELIPLLFWIRNVSKIGASGVFVETLRDNNREALRELGYEILEQGDNLEIIWQEYEK